MFEAYTVAVRVSLRGAAAFTAGLMGISKAFNHLNGRSQELENRLKRIKVLLVGGTMLTGAGLFGLAMFKQPLKDAAAFRHEIEMLKAAGVNSLQVAQAQRAAWATTNSVITSTGTGNLRAIAELRMMFGEHENGTSATAAAINVLPTVQKMQYILENALNERGGKLHEGREAYTIAKALEMRGATQDPAEFARQAEMMTKAIVATRGIVRPQDFLSAIIYGRRAGYTWDDKFLYKVLPTLIQEMQGSGAGGGGVRGPGNAIMSAFAAVVGGTIPQKSLKVWDQLGLIDKSKVVWTKRTHEMKGVGPGGVAGADLFQRNPYDWAQQVLLPAMRSHGITDPAKMRQTLQYLFPNRTASIMDQMVMQGWKFERDMKLLSQPGGMNQIYSQLRSKDPYAAEAATKAQWNKVMTQFGLTVLPLAIVGLQKLTSVLQKLGNFMGRHTALVKAFAIGLAGLSVLSVIAGSILLIAGAFSAVGIAVLFVGPALGAVAAGFLAVAAPAVVAVAAAAALAIGLALLAKHWRQIWAGMKHGADVAWTGIKTAVGAGWDWVVTKTTQAWTSIKNGVIGFVGAIIQWLRNHLPHFNLMDGPAVAGSGGSPGHPHPLGGGHGRSPAVAPLHAQSSTTIKVPVHLDGRQIAEVTAKHLARAVGHTAAIGRHDPTATLAPAGLRYS